MSFRPGFMVSHQNVGPRGAKRNLDWPGQGVRIERSGNSVSADGPDVGRREGWHVEFMVYVPRSSSLSSEFPLTVTLRAA